MKNPCLIVFFILAALWAGSVGTSGQTANETAQELYQLGQAALERKQYEKARDLFLKALSYDNNFAELHARLAETHLLIKDEELGYESYKKCLQIISQVEKPSEEVLKLTEALQPKMKKFQDIEEKISALNDEFVRKIMAIGQPALQASDWLLAEDVFSLVLRLAVDNTDAADSLQSAREEFNRAINEGKVAEEKVLAAACYQEGLDLLKKASYAEAVEKFKKAMLYQTDFSEAAFSLGECQEKLKDPAKAVTNYRYCLKILKSQTQRSKEQNDLMTRAGRALEKIDTQGREFQKAKTEYLAKLALQLGDFMSKKYQRFAYKATQFILLVDPDHKAANTALVKIDKRVIQSPEAGAESKKLNLLAKGRPKKMFNGNDMFNWLTDVSYRPLRYLSVRDSCLIIDPSPVSVKYTRPWEYWMSLQYQEPPPANYVVTARFSALGQVLNPDFGTPEVGILYAQGKDGNDAYIYWYSVKLHRIRTEPYTMEFICRNNFITLLVNNDVITSGDRQGDKAITGLYIKNIKISFSSITIQEVQ